MIGKTVSHYKILEKLGEGGMGVVYKAEDTNLKRQVALKFLPPELTRDKEARERFMHEAQAASALDHPNVCTVHEIGKTEAAPGEPGGQMFIAMGYYEGETLKDKIAGVGAKGPSPLQIDDAIEIVIQITTGLARAHEAGIIHRDIKPANIIITNRGEVKILDFGLAKLSGQTKLTKDGSTLGTAAYMSPEQTRGENTDSRTDIWSIGVVLFEMITGILPFKGDYEQAMQYSIVNEEPEPLTGLRTGISMELERIVSKALAKNPDQRYQHVDELLVDLRPMVEQSIVKGTSSKYGTKPKNLKKNIISYVLVSFLIITAVAVVLRFVLFSQHREVISSSFNKLVVLPFENLGPAEDIYFADGITDEITTRLATVRSLGVISRNSAFHYAGKEWKTEQIGEELNVDFIITGTVRWAKTSNAADRVIITPRLIQVSDDIQIWAEPFDRVIHDIFDIQSEIAVRVVEQLGITLLESEQRAVEENPTKNLDAFQFFLKGRHNARSPHFTVENWKQVIQSYKRAVELDPEFAIAFGELASAHARLFFLRHDLSKERIIMAAEAADRAEALAPDSPEVLLALGYYHLWAYRDTKQALKKWALAEKTLPNDVRILEAKANILALQGRWQETIELINRASLYSPRDASLPTNLAFYYWMTRRYPEAIEACNRAITLAPDESWPYLYKAFINWSWKGATEEARNAINSVNQDYHWVLWAWYWQEVGEKKYNRALERLDASQDEWIRTKMWARPKSLMKAFIYDFLEQPQLAMAAYEKSAALLEVEIEKWPDDPRYHSSLGIVYAALGRKQEAIRQGKRAVELLPISTDAAYGVPYELDLSIVHVLNGDFDSAIDKIEYLLSIPSWISPGWIRMDLRLAPLYNHPGFEQLLKKYGSDF